MDQSGRSKGYELDALSDCEWPGSNRAFHLRVKLNDFYTFVLAAGRAEYANFIV